MAGECESKDYSCYLKGSYYKDLSAEAQGPLADVIKNLPEGLQSFFVSTTVDQVDEEDKTSDYKIGNTWVRVGENEDLTGFRKLDSENLINAFQDVVNDRSKSVKLDVKPGSNQVVELENGNLYITNRAKEWWNESGNTTPDDFVDDGLHWIRLESDEQNKYSGLVEQELNQNHPELVADGGEVIKGDEAARSMIEEKIEGITAEITLSDDFFESYDIDEKSFMQLANGDIYKTTYEEGYDGYAEVQSGLVLGDVGLVSVLDIVKFSVASLFCVVVIILLVKRVLGQRSQNGGQSHFYFRS